MADFVYVQKLEYTSGTFTGTGTGGTLSDPDPNANSAFDIGESEGFWNYIGTVDIDGRECPAFQFDLNPTATRIYDPGPTAIAAGDIPATFPAVTVEPFAYCFLTGTLIGTPDGEQTVETLKIGDLVDLPDGGFTPVKWVGRQTIHTLFAKAERLMPVRFAAGSLGDGLPHSDLTVTADHAMLVGGVLCNASALVDGMTITRVPLEEMGESFTVYHIETEEHEIVLANGAPAETFIDNVSREVFDNYDEFEALYGEVPEMQELPYPRAMSARQVPSHIKEKLGVTKAA